MTDKDYLDAPGLSVVLYHNVFDGTFGDQKMSALEIILHDDRIATNDDVCLLPTPEQWDSGPVFARRVADKANRRLTAFCSYPDRGLSHRLEVTAEEDGVRVAVHLDKPLPEALVGRAGFNVEFLPSAYFGQSYLLDADSGVFPRHPSGPMEKDRDGNLEPQPLASGHRITHPGHHRADPPAVYAPGRRRLLDRRQDLLALTGRAGNRRPPLRDPR